MLLWGFHYGSFDLWGDELISLKDYALVDLVTTVTTYPDPNNHILFNLLNNVASDLLGIRDVFQAMNRAPYLRWLQWVVAAGTCAYVMLLGGKFFSRPIGVLSLVFLVTCLPFLNFTMQLRGYCLSMFFAVAMVFHAWSAEERRSWWHLVFSSLATFGLLYTIPSNAYFALSVGILAAWRTVWPTDQEESRLSLWKRRGCLVVAALAVGALLALLAYSPVLGNLLDSRFVQASPDQRMFILSHRLPQVTLNLASFRYLLIPVALAGILLALRKKTDPPEGIERFWPLLSLFLLPFLFSFFRDDEAFQRTFLFTVPIFSLLLAAGVTWCVAGVARDPLRRTLVTLGTAAYAFGTLAFAHVTVQARLEENLKVGIKEQTILANFYQFHGFQPSQMARELTRVHEERPGPFLVVDALDPMSVGYYLLSSNLTSTGILDIRPTGREEEGTHLAMFQKTTGRGEDLTFFTNNLTLVTELREGDQLLPSIVAAVGNEPSDLYYVVTAFPEKNRELFRTSFFPVLAMETVVETVGFTCFRITQG
jgi:hypothetical protein